MVLSLCNHQIMAVSTFSWWSAWIKSFKNPYSIVIAPEPWYVPNGELGRLNTNQFYYPGWIRINIFNNSITNTAIYLNSLFNRISNRASIHPLLGEGIF